MNRETLAGELQVLKALKVTQNERPAKNTSTANKVLTTNEKETEGEEGIRQAQDQGSSSSTPVLSNSDGITSQTENRSYTSVAISKPILSPEKPWTKVNYGNQKSTGKQHSPTTIKSDQLGKGILFP